MPAARRRERERSPPGSVGSGRTGNGQSEREGSFGVRDRHGRADLQVAVGIDELEHLAQAALGLVGLELDCPGEVGRLRVELVERRELGRVQGDLCGADASEFAQEDEGLVAARIKGGMRAEADAPCRGRRRGGDLVDTHRLEVEQRVPFRVRCGRLAGRFGQGRELRLERRAAASARLGRRPLPRGRGRPASRRRGGTRAAPMGPAGCAPERRASSAVSNTWAKRTRLSRAKAPAPPLIEWTARKTALTTSGP